MKTSYPEWLRALTVREPWASLLVRGLKSEEYRSRNTKRRGLVLIHSSLTYQIGWEEIFKDFSAPCPDELELNCILGAVEIYDCISTEDGYAWKVRNAVKFSNPPECRGALSFWQPKDDEQIEAFEEAWRQLPDHMKK